MTTLRDRIAAKLHATWDLDSHDAEAFVAELFGLFRDEAPLSGSELSFCEKHETRYLWRCGECEEAERDTLRTALESAQSDRQRAVADLFAQVREREAERAELQRRLEEKTAGFALTIDALHAAERERDAAREELRQGSMRLAVEALRKRAATHRTWTPDRPSYFMQAADWLEAEARKAGANG